jgi:hypothetical protein
MRQCPKCSSKFDDDVNFCKACGAMLDAFVEPPPPAADKSQTSAKTDMPREGLNYGANKAIKLELNSSKDVLMNKTPPSPAAGKDKAAASFNRHDRECSRCGSSKLIPNAIIQDQGQGSQGTLRAYVDADPGALIFKDRRYSEVFAQICAECGHVELKARSPRDLYNHYLQSKKN